MIATLIMLPMGALSDDKLVRLYAPPSLIETGLLKHILPRFSLKTSVRVELVGQPTEAEMVIGPNGQPLFEGAGAIWHMDLLAPDHAGAKRLADWLNSDIGLRTITGFAPEGAALFNLPEVAAVEATAVEPEGDVALGYEISKATCARCHAVDEAGRKNDIGSTPSFFVLRAFEDWEYRFTAFYVLKPHAAFTQIAEVTEPFPEDRPSPMVPIELTLDELDAVIAYVAAVQPADLGDPLEHQ